MSKMSWIIVYLLVGGLMFGAMDRDRAERCHTHFSDPVFVMVTTLWPAVVGASITYKLLPNDGECK